MPAITFPASPVNGQVYSDGTSAWQWDGTAWRVIREFTIASNQLGFSQINFGGATTTDGIFYGGVFNPVKGFQIFTSSGLFTPVAGATFYFIDVISAGASGSVNKSVGTATNVAGGSGGGRWQLMIPASYLERIEGTVLVTVGAGGSSITSSAAGPGTIAGNAGGNSSFGSLLTVYGGNVGPVAGGIINSASSAGVKDLATGAAVASTGGIPTATTGSPTQSSPGEWVGGGSLAGNSGGGSVWAGAGGGGAGGGTTAAAGGQSGKYTVGNGAAGSSGNSNRTGSNGADGPGEGVGAGGGGGGAALTTTASGATATAGNGGFPGGGGGAAAAESGGTSTITSGAGGNGMVTVYWG